MTEAATAEWRAGVDRMQPAATRCAASSDDVAQAPAWVHAIEVTDGSGSQMLRR